MSTLDLEDVADLSIRSTMERLPVFPLPDVVFFPHMLMPLHVFEPRYLAMLRDVLEGERLMGIVQLAPGWQASYYDAPVLQPVLGIGQVIQQESTDDGRANIVVRGLARGEILEELPSELPYRLVRARVLGVPVEDERKLVMQLATVRHLFVQLLERLPQLEFDADHPLFSSRLEPSVALDAITCALPLDSATQQSLLEEVSVLRRADLLSDLLVGLVAGDDALDSL